MDGSARHTGVALAAEWERQRKVLPDRIGYDGYLGIECRVDGPYDEAIREAVTLIRREWQSS